MENFFLGSAIFLCAIMTLSIYRAVVGPTILDRLIGVNAIGSKTTPLLIIIGLLFGTVTKVNNKEVVVGGVDMFIDIALAYALLNFIAVIAASRYFQKRKGLHDEKATKK
ncbi:MAG: pH regulation protein F [Desulfobacterales bacterium]|nr:pH regulation protein F [Desulfobacterales bacterium]MCP4162366.1 pH regulation protein F [Deltaproteobacteria bacterium]